MRDVGNGMKTNAKIDHYELTGSLRKTRWCGFFDRISKGMIATEQRPSPDSADLPSPAAEKNVLSIPRSFIATLLASIFALGFLITDYWNIPGFPVLKSVLLIGTILIGAAWSWIGSDQKEIVIRPRSLIYLAVLILVALVLNFRPLVGDLAWRGDEDHHFLFVLNLYRVIETIPWYYVVLTLVTWVLILYLSWYKPRIALPFGLISLALLLHFYPHGFGSLRYPFFNYWVYYLAMLPATVFIGPYHEALLRIVPFLSALTLAWIFQRTIIKKMEPLSLILGGTILLIPSVYNYSTILYLEMPAVLLMTLACLQCESLLTRDFHEVKKHIGWYALILIGFIKETTLPFLLIFVGCRWVVRLWGRIKSRKKANRSVELETANPNLSLIHFFKGEVAFSFVSLLPIFYYLVFRGIYYHGRTYQFHPSNLFNPAVARVFVQSLFDQFGLFILLFIAGCVILIIKRKYPSLFFSLLYFFGYCLYLILEQKKYIGYSRFNLFLLPVLLTGSFILIQEILKKRKLIAYLLVVLTLITSILLTPILRDGTRLPGWGNYFFDTGEHYYPVEEAMSWLKEKDPDGNILFAGLYYKYTYSFYLDKLNWVPEVVDLFLSDIENQDDDLNLKNALIEAEKKGYNNVLFFILGDKVPQLPENSPYYEAMVFKNLAHKIVIYIRYIWP